MDQGAWTQVDLVLLKMGKACGLSKASGKGCDASWTIRSMTTSTSEHKGWMAVVTRRAALSEKATSATNQINSPGGWFEAVAGRVSRR